MTMSVLVLVTMIKFAFAEEPFGAPEFFGAPLPGVQLKLERSGWDECEFSMCGGSERLGAVFDPDLVKGGPTGDVRQLSTEGAKVLLNAVRAHGVVVIHGQKLSRAEQVEFTAKLGEVVVLPESFVGNDPEPLQPEIQRITNFWSNGTWKGPTHKFGGYWHQDGDFWTTPKHHIISVLHAIHAPERGETGFADLRAGLATLSKRLRQLAEKATVVASVRDVPDFKGEPELLAKFPDAHHPIVDKHPLDNGPLLYIGCAGLRVVGLASEAQGKNLLYTLMNHTTSPSYTYYHHWEPGDIVLWDNIQTLHHSFPYNNDGSQGSKRELYRTQARVLHKPSKSEL